MNSVVLDSDILIYFLKGRREIVSKIASYDSELLATTRINCAELLYGAHHSRHVEKNIALFTPFLAQFRILEFDAVAAERFAREKARLNRVGTPLADMDLMIAAIVLAHGLPLATNNVKHFERVEGLELVRWL